MPSPRRDRETAPVAVSWSVERRPRDAMPDYGDRYLPGYVPGVTSRRAYDRQAGERPRERRNGLPELRPYVTDEIREYYAAQGITLPGARTYLGSGHDQLTGNCQCPRKNCAWQGKGTADHA